jgi:transposase
VELLLANSCDDEGQAFYQLRLGIEGTISKGTRGFGLRRTRYRGLDKTHLSHVATAAAMNIDRYFDYRQDVEKEPKRISRFAALAIGN